MNGFILFFYYKFIVYTFEFFSIILAHNDKISFIDYNLYSLMHPRDIV